MAGAGITKHRICLLQGGGEYFPALVAAINASYQEVLLETYIFHVEGAVVAVAEALVRAAQRGVEVRIAMDGVGTPPLPAYWQAQFEAAGVQWHRFLPLHGLGVVVPGRWRRLHRKLCVVDGRLLFCGGINLLDDFLDPNHGPQSVARLDYAVCVSGPQVVVAQRVMVRFWSRLQARYQLQDLQFRAAGRTLLGQMGTRMPSHIDVSPWGDGNVVDAVHARLVLRDNVRNRTRIEQAYRKAIATARSEILIASAYFLPGRRLRVALVQAARRGVRVQLVLQGRYEYFLQYHAARAVYAELLAAGIEIWEYHAGFLHAKVAVMDARWSTVGSSNLDPLSLLLAREANVVVEDERFAQLLRQRLLGSVAQHCRQVGLQGFASRPWQSRFLDGLAYVLVRISLWVLGRRY